MANAAVITKSTLIPSKAPNLMIGPVDYTQQFMDQYSNTLRLYFNEVDSYTRALSGPNGGKYLRFPNISAYSSSSQYALDNTPTTVLWGTLVTGSGFTLNANSTATCQQAGIYKIDYSLQFANTDNTQHDAVVWLQNNGSDVTESATVFTLGARKSAGVYTYVCGYSHVTFEVNAGDVISLVWATDKGANASGSALGIFMEAITNQTLPYVRPSIPAAIGTIAFISAPTT